MVIPYDNIEVQNVVTGNLFCLSLFLFFSIYNTTKKSVNTYFRICKPVRIMAHTNREFNSSGENANHLFDTYKNSGMRHGKYMFKTISNMTMSIICANPSYKNPLPHWKCFMRCCVKCPCIGVTSP